jgi:5'(3')-deoxyribonucleotidase
MNDKQIIALDVDGILLDLHTPWLARYNRDYNDSLRVEQVTDWSIHKFVKPECGKKIYAYLDDDNPFNDIYKVVNPIAGALQFVKTCRDIGDVIFVTCPTEKSMGARYHCLKRHGFFNGTDDPQAQYIECKRKELIKADFLVDDCYDNCKSFGRNSIMFIRPWNAKLAHTNYDISSAVTYADVITTIENEMVISKSNSYHYAPCRV